MKMIFGMCAMILLGAVGYVVWNTQHAEHHGKPFSQGISTVKLADLVDSPADHVSKTVRVEGVVDKQCPVTGCWFFLKDGGKEMKIEMGDVTPTLPKRVGKSASVEGALVKSGDGYEFVGNAVEFK